MSATMTSRNHGPMHLVVLAMYFVGVPLPATAQGPRPVGIQHPARVTPSGPAKFATPTLGEPGRVRPNHWKRGARIGVAVSVIPLTIFTVTEGCRDFPGSQARCAVAATGFIALTGVFGGLVGGFIGSFFPRQEPAKAATGNY